MFEYISWAWENHPILTILAGWAIFLVIMCVVFWHARRSDGDMQRELEYDLIAWERQNRQCK